MRNRLVYPKAHRFRLFWPQKWWPDVTNETLAAQKLPGAVATSGATPGQGRPELIDPAHLTGHTDSPRSTQATSTTSSQRGGSGEFRDRKSTRLNSSH